MLREYIFPIRSTTSSLVVALRFSTGWGAAAGAAFALNLARRVGRLTILRSGRNLSGGIMGLLEAHAGLAGKVAVVVGGAGGFVGRGVTLGLARAGVHIAACDNDEAAVRAIAPEVEALGPRILAVPADVTDEQSLDAFYDRAGAQFDRLDILVNVAGGVKRCLFSESTREDNARDIRLNYGYIIDSMRRAIPLIRRGGRGGSIINFTTIEAHRGAATYAVYAGAKAATTNFSRAMAVELGADDIRVNLIAPDTSPGRASNSALYAEDFERLARLGSDALARAYQMYVPLKRAPSVEDIVNGVLFLASDLSRSITGTTLHIDGGTIAALGFLDWPYGDSFMPAPLGGTLGRLFGKS
jgi:NAD(P)-dependent dehydrogenase (short-subunit alcohol dehydrogenase family)